MKLEIGVHGVTEIKSYNYGSFTDRTIDMFDFPVSPTFAGYYQEMYGYPSQRQRIDNPHQERVECKPTELKPIRTIMRENHELKARIDLMESDVSGLKKGYHTHTGGKRKSKYD